MKRPRIGALLLAATLAGAGTADAAGAVVVFRGATVVPVSSPPIELGIVVVRDGKIDAVGRADSIRVPRGAEVRDVSGKFVLPGLVDAHSHLGDVAGGDSSGALHPSVRALDAVDVHDESFWRARAGGITTVNVMPGSGHLMSGQTVYLKLRADPGSIEDWLYCADPIDGVCGSMKMANGTNSLRDDPFPGTRAKSAAMVRELFVAAQNYQAKRKRAQEEKEKEEDDEAKPAERDLGLEAVAQVLDGTRRVQFHTHRHDDIATILRLHREFGFDFVVQHGTESWMLADELAREGVSVSFTLLDSPGGKEEILRMRMDAPALLERAGVDVGLNTDDPINDSRLLLRIAAMAARHGLSREGALRAVTLVPARQLGLDDRIGSIEPGKDADLVVLSGDPLSVYTQVLETWVEGRRVYDATDPEHHEYAVGGWRVYPPGASHDDGGCW
jgi:imidazolonepropionase-like amidohydrolase